MTTAAAPLAKPIILHDEMVSALKKKEENTEFIATDLVNATYVRDNEFGTLTLNNEKFTLTEWSARQLCRRAAVPFGFFKRASEDLAVKALGEFIPTAKDTQAKLAVKRYSGKNVLRGILAVDYPDVRNSQVLEGVTQIAKEFVIEAAPWYEENDAPWLRTRLVYPKAKFLLDNEELTLGLDVTCSELGGGPLAVNLLLFRPICTNGAMVLFEKKPYFYFDYESVLGFDVAEVVQRSISRMGVDTDRIQAAVVAAKQTKISLDDTKVKFAEMVQTSYLNKGVVQKALVEAEKAGVENVWDMVNALTAASRGFRDGLRLRYETVAGSLLGLDFDRKTQDETKYGEGMKAPLMIPAKLSA